MSSPLQEFVACKTIAIVGASRSNKKFGTAAMRELRARGYELIPVHPDAPSIDGVPCYPSLKALPKPVDGLLVIVPPARAEPLLREAADASIRNVWLQQGSSTPAVVELAQSLGLRVVSDRCILMYMQPVRSIHAFHRFLARLFGTLEPSEPPALPAHEPSEPPS